MGASEQTIHVLHVDDSLDFAETASDFVEREDDRLATETAADANEGLDKLAGGDFDCIVSDYRMPGMDGVEFLERVRDSYPDLPFILYTGRNLEEVADEVISDGAAGYLQKRCGTDQYTVLADWIADAVEASRRRQTLAEQIRGPGRFSNDLPGVVYRTRNEPGWPTESLKGDVESYTGYRLTNWRTVPLGK